MDRSTVEKEALLLPEDQRAILADKLIESLSPTPPDLREAWIREADHRIKAFAEGKMVAVDGPEAIARLREKFRE